MGNETFYGDGLILVCFSWRVFNLVSPKLIQKDFFFAFKKKEAYILEFLALSKELQSYYHYKIIVIFIAVGVTFIFTVSQIFSSTAFECIVM